MEMPLERGKIFGNSGVAEQAILRPVSIVSVGSRKLLLSLRFLAILRPVSIVSVGCET